MHEHVLPAVGYLAETESWLRRHGHDAEAEAVATSRRWVGAWAGPTDGEAVRRIERECSAEILDGLQRATLALEPSGLEMERRVLEIFRQTFVGIAARTAMVGRLHELQADLAARVEGGSASGER